MVDLSMANCECHHQMVYHCQITAGIQPRNTKTGCERDSQIPRWRIHGPWSKLWGHGSQSANLGEENRCTFRWLVDIHCGKVKVYPRIGWCSFLPIDQICSPLGLKVWPILWLVGGFNHLEKGLSHILWKIKNVPNHQPVGELPL
jgi:hypothetical protein